MEDDKNPETPHEPGLDLNPRTDRSPDHASLNDMMESLNESFGEAEPDDGSSLEDTLRAEIAVLKDQVLRGLAEVENVRRRFEREKQDNSKYAIANFAKSVLPVADNLERALASVSLEARAKDTGLENLCVGLELTHNELKAANEKFGIKPIEALGKRLDPNLHQAMFEVEDASVPVGTVVQVIQPGYVIHDRLLRPAMVGVAKGGPKEAPANENPAAGAHGKPDQPGKRIDTEL